ncbi:protease inhibitor I42 family protein [Mycobacterium sp.]|uniref:protease inhibitor I42 family protein n=1 Tax=Mycobacterium sp. TaxID=1785 RepID=UPI003BA8B23B
MKIRYLLAATMLVLSAVVGAVGCSTGDDVANMTIEVSMDDVLKRSTVGRNVTLVVGDTLKVVLGSNRTTPYRWAAQTKIGDRKILRQTRHEYQRSVSGRAGAPGAEIWMFTALAAGATTIVTDYSGLVDYDTTPVCTFTAKVKVDAAPLYAGFGPLARIARP